MRLRACAVALGVWLVAAPAAGHPGHAPPTVQVGLYEFKPATITVTAGDIVQWQWAGPDVDHSVTSDAGSGEKFDSGVMDAEGDSFTYYFGTPGTYAYHCKTHASMHGKVVVRAGAPVDSAPPRLSRVKARVRGRLAVLRFKITEGASVTATSRRSGSSKTARSFTFVKRGKARVKVKLGARGTYRVTLSAQDATGNSSRTASLTVRR